MATHRAAAPAAPAAAAAPAAPAAEAFCTHITKYSVDNRYLVHARYKI